MEQLLHYVWKYRLFQKELLTTDGKPIEVIDVGISNTDEGPDFFNAKIKISDKIWVGNIEIHHSSEDWYKHKHHTNPNYNSVVLHVVEYVNRDIINEALQQVLQCQISYPKQLKDNIDFLLNSDISVSCLNYIGSFNGIYMSGWLNTLLIERLERKSNDIYAHLSRTKGSWEEVFYILLCRNFGFGLNSDVFERLALSLPLRFIQKQGDDIKQIEALLFGQGGFLEELHVDEYAAMLSKEYSFLQHKYELKPLPNYLFRKMRIRPSASPCIRIAQLAVLLHKAGGLFSKVLKCTDIGQIRLLFHENASEYWQTHYSFGEESPRKTKYLGDSSLDVILINTVIPILFAYGKNTGDDDLCERALSFLEKIKPEVNYITREFMNARLSVRNAYDSQAFIQLRKEYCDKRKCLYCRIGYRIILKNNIKRNQRDYDEIH